MEDYTEIINSYMNFFYCHLLEYSGVEDSGIYFDSVYSYTKNHEKNMREVIYELHIPDICSKDIKDIVFFYNSAIDYLRHKIRKELLMLDEKERKKVFYILATFQAEFHGRINLVYGGIDLDINNAHFLERNILQLVKNRICAHEIRGICAIDKYAVQVIFQECIEADLMQNGNEVNQIDTKSFCEIYGCALTIIELMEKCSLLPIGIFKSPVIQIDSGNFKFVGNSDYNTEQYIDKCEADMLCYERAFPEAVKVLLDNNFYKAYGFKIDMVKKIAYSEPRWLRNNNLATESNYATIIGEFMLMLKCTMDVAENIFSYLCIDECKKKEKRYDSPEKDDNRIFEKCILKIDEDRYLYSQVLMEYAYKILERKLIFNLLEKCSGLNERIIRKRVKTKFEEEIEQFLKQYNTQVIRNVHKLDDGKVLSNEVDIMCVQKGILYVIECKDVSFRFTPAGFAADISKEREFIRKLQRKIESVEHNIEYFRKVFNQPIESIEGCLVYRTTNFVTETMKFDKGIGIMSANHFKDKFVQIG